MYLLTINKQIIWRAWLFCCFFKQWIFFSFVFVKTNVIFNLFLFRKFNFFYFINPRHPLYESTKLRAKNVLTCQRAVRTYVLTCQRALRAYVLTCQRALGAYMLTCQRALRAYVLKCQHANVSCVLKCSRANVPCVLTCLTANMLVLKPLFSVSLLLLLKL